MNGNYYIAGVLAAIGAVLLVLAMAWVGTGPSPDKTMEWDDYEPLGSDVTGVGGVLEIVEVGDTKYIHAKELGDGVILHQGSKTTVKVTKATADLVLMNGQSNAAYLYADTSATASPGPGEGYYFGWNGNMPSSTSDDLTGCKIRDMVGSDGSPQVGNKGPAFASAWSSITGHKTIWAHIGIGGMTVSKFDPETGPMWEWNAEIVGAVMEQIGELPIEIDKTMMLWAQGEANYQYGTTAAQYEESFMKFYTEMKNGGLGADVDSFHFVCGKDLNLGWVNDTFKSLAAQLDGTSVCVSDDLVNTFTMANGLMRTQDDIHYTQPGCNAVGAAAARGVASFYGYSLDRAPIFLFQNEIPCDLNEPVALPTTARAYTLDGNWSYADATWDGAADTSQYGVTAVNGEASTPAPYLEHSPVVSLVKTGYVGWVNGLEYIRNGASTVAVMNHEWDYGSVTIPSSVNGLTVTEVLRQSFHHVPYTVIDVPDTVTAIDDYAIFSVPLVREVTMSDSLTSVGVSGITCKFVKNGTELTMSEIRADPSIIGGHWLWNGTTAGKVYYQEATP